MRAILNYLFGKSETNFAELLTRVSEPTLAAPNRDTVRQVVEILSGNDPSLRSQFAFASLVKHISKSQHSHSWIVQLKNITLLDRLIEESLFCREISELPQSLLDHLPCDTFAGLRTNKLTFAIWRLVKYSAQVIDTKLHILCFKRSQRKVFLSGLNYEDLLEQLEILESLFRVCFEVSKQLRGRDKANFREELYSMELVQHIALLLAHKFVVFYACELLCLQQTLSMLMEQGEADLKRLSKLCFKFQANSFEFIRFLLIFKRAKGFEEFNYEEFNPFQNANLPKIIGNILKEMNERSQPLSRELSFRSSTAIRVELRSFGGKAMRQASHPRLQCPQPVKESQSVFSEWTISFSDSFPQQEMMTLELILDIRSQEEQNNEVEYDLSNEGEYYEHSGNFLESSSRYTIESLQQRTSVVFQASKLRAYTYTPLPNLYSSQSQVWNQS